MPQLMTIIRELVPTILAALLVPIIQGPPTPSPQVVIAFPHSTEIVNLEDMQGFRGVPKVDHDEDVADNESPHDPVIFAIRVCGRDRVGARVGEGFGEAFTGLGGEGVPDGPLHYVTSEGVHPASVSGQAAPRDRIRAASARTLSVTSTQSPGGSSPRAW